MFFGMPLKPYVLAAVLSLSVCGHAVRQHKIEVDSTGVQEMIVDEAGEVHETRQESADWHTRMTSFHQGQVKAALAGKRSEKGAKEEAIVVIDVQHCFTNGEDANGKTVATGGLHSKRGTREWKKGVVDFVKEKVAAGHPIVLLQDFHPKGHVSYLKEGEGTWNPEGTFKKRIMPKALIPGADKDVTYEPPVFPAHCQQGTKDAELIDGLCEAVGGSYVDHACKVLSGNHLIVQKGTNVSVDSFGGIYDNRMGYNNFFAKKDAFPALSKELAEESSWGVLEWMNQKEIKKAKAIGIADDFCVKTTALDLVDDAKAKLLGVPALEHVEVLPEYTYGIFRHLAVHEKVGDFPWEAETKADKGLIEEYTVHPKVYIGK